MARTLLLIRHAKAAQVSTSDETRELAARGENDARAAGRWLAAHDLAPSHVIVSSATRAQQTWSAIASQLAAPPTAQTDGRIYDNTVESLLDVIHEAASEQTVIALVGHNPSMHELAAALDDGDGDEGARAAVASSYPTNGIATFDVTGEWRDLAAAGATLRHFVAPRA